MTNLIEQIQEKIQDEKIEPAARWKFLARSSVFWGLAVLSIIFGIMAMAIIINIVDNHDWDLYNHWEIFADAIPYVWLLLFTAFAGSAYYNLRHSKRGYHYPLLGIIGFMILVSALGGYIVYRTSLADAMNELLSQNVYYQHTCDTRMRVWQQPERGFLAGQIMETGTSTLLLKDLDGRLWLVRFPMPVPPLPADFGQGKMIKLYGTSAGSGIFDVQQFRPWGKRKMQPMRNINRGPQGLLNLKQIYEETNRCRFCGC